MVQCPEAHLFCSSCVSQYAATKLGEHDSRIVCMHSSGCSLPFPVSELRRILSPKLMSLFERVQQQKELEAAGLEGLEECPFCDWKCVLEVSKEEEKLFRCGNEEGGCGVVSCRSCKKKVSYLVFYSFMRMPILFLRCCLRIIFQRAAKARDNDCHYYYVVGRLFELLCRSGRGQVARRTACY